MLEFVLSPATARFVAAGIAHGPRLELLGDRPECSWRLHVGEVLRAVLAQHVPDPRPLGRAGRAEARQQLALAARSARPRSSQRTARRSNRNSDRALPRVLLLGGPPRPQRLGVLGRVAGVSAPRSASTLPSASV